MAFLTKLVAYYLFEKAKTLINWTTYHGIYRNGGLVVFKRKNIAQEIKYGLAEF